MQSPVGQSGVFIMGDCTEGVSIRSRREVVRQMLPCAHVFGPSKRRDQVIGSPQVHTFRRLLLEVVEGVSVLVDQVEGVMLPSDALCRRRYAAAAAQSRSSGEHQRGI